MCTFVWFFTSMDSYVSLLAATNSKCTFTMWAFDRLFSSVDSDVSVVDHSVQMKHHNVDICMALHECGF